MYNVGLCQAVNAFIQRFGPIRALGPTQNLFHYVNYSWLNDNKGVFGHDMYLSKIRIILNYNLT